MIVLLDQHSQWIGNPPKSIVDISCNNTKLVIRSLLPPENHEIDQNNINIFFDSNEPDYLSKRFCKIIGKEYKDPIFYTENLKKMDLILTRRPELLSLPNSKLFVYGTTWIEQPTKYWENKKTEISFSLTNKIHAGVYGYELRHLIASQLEKLREVSLYSIDGYDSSHCPTNYPSLNKRLSEDHGDRSELMKYKFNIAIENEKLPNYFTEKLIDCFATKTIPIYYGCSNISDYFNTDGIIMFNTLEELRNILSTIKIETYERMSDAIEDNYNRCLKYTGFFGSRVYNEIETILKQKGFIQ